MRNLESLCQLAEPGSPGVVGQHPPARGSSHCARFVWMPRAAAHEGRRVDRIMEREYLAAYVKSVLDVFVVLGQVAAAIPGELHVAQLHVALVAALQIATFIQPQHDATP